MIAMQAQLEALQKIKEENKREEITKEEIDEELWQKKGKYKK